jgi:hypothetical protein
VEVEKILGGALNLHLYFFLISNQTLFLLFLDICARIAEVFAHCSCQNAGYILNRAFTKVLTSVLCQPYSLRGLFVIVLI